jgi:hypothetical protein
VPTPLTRGDTISSSGTPPTWAITCGRRCWRAVGPWGRFLDDRGRRRGANLKLVPTRANGQPAFGCYLPDAYAAIAHAYGLLVLTVRGDQISAIRFFGDRAVMARFGLPRTLDS